MFQLTATFLGGGLQGSFARCGPAVRRVAFGYMSGALNLVYALMLLFWRDKDAEALDRVARTHSDA